MTADLGPELSGRLAGDLFMSLDTSLTLATLRELGPARLERLEARMLRSHQRRFFLAGLDKLGLRDDPSDAIRCARYHCLSNHLGGLRMRYAVESPGKAWVFYETPSWLDSPWSPGMSQAVFRPQLMIGVMRAWHANNGRLLGNPGLVFAVTELVARGDGRDGGYFLDTGAPVPAGSRLRLAFGERPPPGLPMLEPELDRQAWPPERQARAWRNYATAYAAARVAWLLAEVATGPAVVDSGLRTLLFQRSESLAAAIGAAALPAPRRCVEVLAAFHRLAGLEVEVDEGAGRWLVRVGGSWLDRAPEPLARGAREVAEAAIASAWTAWAGYRAPGLSLRAVARGDGVEWRFDLGRGAA